MDDIVLHAGEEKKMPDHFFQPKVNECSLEHANDIIGSGEPTWPSWQAASLAQQVSDLNLLVHFANEASFGLLFHLWKGRRLLASLVIREVGQTEFRLSLGQLAPHGVVVSCPLQTSSSLITIFGQLA